MKKFWTITAQGRGALQILLYDYIGQDELGGISAQAFAEDLQAAGPGIGEIHLRVNSPGGNFFDGLAIYNTLLSCGARVTAQVDGIAASIASVIIMAAGAGGISMGSNGMLMIHNPAIARMGGTSNDLRKMAETMDKTKASMITAYRRHTKKSVKEISALMDAETWFSAAEAVDAGFAERIITPEDDTADLAANLDLSRFTNVPEQLAARIAAKATIPIQTATERERLQLRVDLLRRLHG